MSRFAALLDHRGPTSAARRIEADLARRTQGRAGSWEGDGIFLWQGGSAAAVSKVCTSGPLTLAGELALTDLAELRGALAADPGTGSAQLVLAAWLRWGAGALDRLNGAFAFVIRDARLKRLTAVRDRFGIHPLAYVISPQRAVFASDLSTVLAGLDAVPDIDPAWVAGFLSGQTLDKTTTAWTGVLRLPPGHLITLEHDGNTDLRAWYRLEATTPPAVAETGPALRAALAHATTEACADAPTATMLSGGLDSSALSLLSVANGARRPALSLRYDDPELDEGRYIQDVLQQSGGRLDPVFLPGEEADGRVFDLDRQLDSQDHPVFAPGLNRGHQLYQAARELGYGAILDGHGGDEVIGGTFYDIGLLAQGRNWPLALSVAARYARFTGQPVTSSLARLLAARGRHGFGRLGRLTLQALGHSRSPRQDPQSLVDPQLAREVRLAERLQDLNRHDPRDRDVPASVRQHASMLAGPMSAMAFETLGRAAQAEGMQARYPFYDHRVVELCVWQPPAAKFAKGRPRMLLREAMRGVLPESVRLRRDKADFTGGFWNTLRRDPDGRLAAFAADPGSLRGWVNAETLRVDAERLAHSAEPDAQTAFRLWRALCLATWLERGAAPGTAAQPVSPVLASAR